MTSFTYNAKDQQGKSVSAVLEAASRPEALSVLQASGMTILDLRANDNGSTAQPRVRKVAKTKSFQVNARIGLNDLAIFCRQLSISVNSGMPLREALETIAEDMDHAGLRRALERVVKRLYAGLSFSEALDEQRRLFGPTFVSLVRSAEEAGSLPQTLDQTANYLEKTDRLMRKIKSMTAYPAFVGGFFLLVCSIMTLVVLPKFEKIFSGFNAELPWVTRTVFSANDFLNQNILLVGGVILALGVVWNLYKRTPPGRIAVDRVKLKLPVIGPCLRKVSAARFCRNLSIMIRGGVPMATAMDIASGVCGNHYLERSLQRARERIVSGSDIASSLEQEQAFPRLMVRMVGLGERSGRMPEVLDRVSDAYENEVENSITMAMAMAEPLFICLFGAAILIMVLAIYMPIFTVSSSV